MISTARDKGPTEPGVQCRIQLPYPHAGQQRVLREAGRFNVLSAGRRWRKTTLVVPRAFETAINGGTHFWGAPTYDQTEIAWEESNRAIRNAGWGVSKSVQRLTLNIHGAGRIMFRSLDDPDNARGKTAHSVTIDEAGDVQEVAWYEVILPMLLDTGGSAWLIGTPKGRNWFHREWAAAQEDQRKSDWRAWQIPTLGVEITPDGLVRAPHPYENPHIQFTEILRMYRDMSERRFRQEILAEFIDDAGGVFRGVKACATVPLRELGVPYAGTFVMGVDWGRSVDFTVLVLLDRVTKRVVDFDRFNRVDWPLQLGRIRAMYERWHKVGGMIAIHAEENSMGQPHVAALQRDGLPVVPFETNNASKALLVDNLSLMIERGRVAYPNLPPLVNELEAFTQTRLPSGLMRYHAPPGENSHDDCVMAFGIAALADRDSVLLTEKNVSVGPGLVFDSAPKEPDWCDAEAWR